MIQCIHKSYNKPMAKEEQMHLRISKQEKKQLKEDAKLEDRSISNLLLWCWKQWEKKRGRGFTFIELLIVFLIIAILVGAMVPMFRSLRLDAQINKAQKELEAIKKACQRYRFDVGSWPSFIFDSTILINPPVPPSGWRGPYLDLDSWKIDPWGQNVYYVFWKFWPPQGTNLYAVSFGPNKNWENCLVDDICLQITPDYWK
ncbi:MAG: type II secretion system protein [Candidatus Omnitrophota bacterium]